MSTYHRRIIRHLREVARRRGGFTHAQLAILEFHQTMEASGEGPSNALQPKARLTEPTYQFPPMPKSPHSASEDERRTRHSEMCGEVEDDARYCPKCGVRLDEDDAERTDETEGRSGGLRPRDDVNDLGDDQPSYHGQDAKPITYRAGKGGTEAVREFRSSYNKLKESATFSPTRAQGF